LGIHFTNDLMPPNLQAKRLQMLLRPLYCYRPYSKELKEAKKYLMDGPSGNSKAATAIENIRKLNISDDRKLEMILTIMNSSRP
jgi:hypothetical protein